MDKDFFTKLTYEYKSPDDFGPMSITNIQIAWDLDTNELLDMVKTIYYGAGYVNFEHALARYLTEHSDKYEVTEKVAK